MRLQRGVPVAGLDPEVARTVARAVGRSRVNVAGLADIANMPMTTAGAALRQLEEAGFIQTSPDDPGPWGTRYEVTMTGSALAMASFLKPMTRLKAEFEMNRVIERADAINQDCVKITYVEEIIVIGSYADPEATDIGDLDLIVKLVRRDSEADRVKAAWDYIDATGARPPTLMQQLFWPELEAKKILKNRSGRISILDNNDDYQDFAKHVHVVYRREPRLVQATLPVA